MTEIDFKDKIEQLTFQVQQKVGKPMSINVARAIIESFGIRDIDIAKDYGVESISVLSEIVYDKLLKRNKNEKNSETIELDYSFNIKDIWIFIKNFSVGLFYVFPIFFQVLCVVVFGYSLWVYSNFNILQSTSVVIGVISSLVLTGGIVMVVSKQISFYWNHKNGSMVFQTTIYLLVLGLKILAIANILFILFAFLFEFFSLEMAALSAVYSILIGFMLLLIAPLYVVKRRVIIAISIIIGSLISLLLKFFTTLYVYLTHWIGILIVSLILIGYLIKYFKKTDSFDIKFGFKDVKNEFILYNNYVYFIYGTLFFLYVFLDRILAWSVHDKERFLYFIFFDKDYEIGMDIALLTYLLVAGVFEYSITKFAEMLDDLQSKIDIKGIKEYGRFFLIKHYENVSLLFIVSCIAFAIQFFAIYSPSGYDAYFVVKLNNINRMVTIVGSLGYFLFAWAVLNVLYFFTLGQPMIPLKGIIFAYVINLLVGLGFSRYVSYEFSVVGFLCGSLFFMLYTNYHLRKFFKKMDYYYYAAF